jgi:hypothetical protein
MVMGRSYAGSGGQHLKYPQDTPHELRPSQPRGVPAKGSATAPAVRGSLMR